MKQIITLALAAILMIGVAKAQEFKISKNSGRLEINIGKVTVEGYNGNEIIFTSKDRERKDDERAKGLKEINGLGLDDNTGLGINVVDKGTTVVVKQLKKMNSPEIKIMVPKGVTISYAFESQYGGDVSFKNVEGEIEVSANYNSVELINVSGPITAKSIYGHIEASFDQTVKGPISIVSVYGYADVTLPGTVKANLKLSTSYGELFMSPDFKMEVDRGEDDENRVTGKINGGGINIGITCNYGKVYVRKK
jgi:predicted membrane protein